jgi:hypothetical protein
MSIDLSKKVQPHPVLDFWEKKINLLIDIWQNKCQFNSKKY